MLDWFPIKFLIEIYFEWKTLITVTGIFILQVAGLIATIHILLKKRDPRAALGWIIVCLGFPGIGVLIYIIFGINRIKMRAADWKSHGRWGVVHSNEANQSLNSILEMKRDFSQTSFSELANLSESVVGRTSSPNSLLTGNYVETLHNGEEAYPKILECIRNAKKSIYLLTYIFETNDFGKELIQALADAKDRGVEVKVLIDGLGSMYSYPRAYRLLKKKGVRVARFLPFSISLRSIHFNLRNHRKIITVDGCCGFTGGINLGDRHLINHPTNKKRVVDVHFYIEGPIIGQMQDVFWEDWFFVTGEEPSHPLDYDDTIKGDMICRGITAGPNEDIETLRLIYTGAFACAKKSIRIMTPYFIPDNAMISALNNAALRGVKVEIFIPEKNNIPFAKWATQSLLWEMLRYDVQFYYMQGDFVHSKLMVIDDFYSLIGSANLDPRSLRLNFEFNVEVFHKSFAQSLINNFETTKKSSRHINLQEMDKRSAAVKIRDGICKLFSPYL